MQTSFEIQLVWNQVCLLVLLELVDQGGLGLGGDWGPLKFAPQQSESQVCQGLAFTSSHFLQLHLRHQGPAVDPGEYSSEGAEGSKLDKGQLILHHHHLGGRRHGGGGGYQSVKEPCQAPHTLQLCFAMID